MEGVFNEDLLVLIHVTESGFKFPPQLFQNIHKSSVAEVLLQRWVICGDNSEFREVNYFSVRYILYRQWRFYGVARRGRAATSEKCLATPVGSFVLKEKLWLIGHLHV